MKMILSIDGFNSTQQQQQQLQIDVNLNYVHRNMAEQEKNMYLSTKL